MNRTYATMRIRPRSGFTLIELLVVIAIIAILASLLLPAMNRAKGKAQSIACVNNLKQLQVAVEMYKGDHGNYYPPNRTANTFGYYESIQGAWVLGNAKKDKDDSGLRRGALWDYIGAAAVYLCPSDTSKVDGKPQLRRFRSYQFNGFLHIYYQPGHAQSFVNIEKDSDGRAMPSIISFLCVNEKSIDAGDFGLANPSGVRVNWWNTPGERHNRGANLSFLDGSASYHRWRFTPRRADGSGPFPAANAEDRLDLRWLAERVGYSNWAGWPNLKWD